MKKTLFFRNVFIVLKGIFLCLFGGHYHRLSMTRFDRLNHIYALNEVSI